MPDAQGNALPGEPGYTAPNQSGGLINANAGSTPASAPDPNTQAVASQTTATPFTVAPNQTVASNIDKIISADSPLLQHARTRAAEASNARGLLNSSIGVSAGESALYDAALPIAQADAGVYERASTNTAQAANAAGTLNAQLKTGVAQSNAQAVNTQALQQIQSDTTLTVAEKQAKTQLTIAGSEQLTQRALADVQANTTMTVAEKQAATQDLVSARQAATQVQTATIQANSSLANIDADGRVRTQIAQISAGYQTLIQTSQSAADLYKSTMATLSQISTDPNLADKTGALNNAMAALNDGLKLVGDIQGLNLGSTLTFSAPAGFAPVVAAPAPAGLINQPYNGNDV